MPMGLSCSEIRDGDGDDSNGGNDDGVGDYSARNTDAFVAVARFSTSVS